MKRKRSALACAAASLFRDLILGLAAMLALCVLEITDSLTDGLTDNLFIWGER